MGKATVTTELIRRLLNEPPPGVRDFRDPKWPGLVLRARPSGVHSWRVRTADHRWISLGRADELSLAKAREACQTLRAKATLGEKVATGKSPGRLTLGQFLDTVYEPWMRATYTAETEQPVRLRSGGCPVGC